jgi:hypothetical protein
LLISLIFFLSFAGAVNAAQNDTLDKLLSEASPGWYLHIKSEISYIGGGNTELGTPFVIMTTHPSESFNLLTSDWDEKNKPKFLRKQSQRVSSLGCFDDTLVFRVGDEEVRMVGKYGNTFGYPSPPLSNWSHTDCDRILSWELLQKKCENLVSCISGKFAQKFPFDILFNLPPTQITCPKVNFFGSEFDLCFIYEAMRLVKYPIVAALIIKLFLYL